MTLRLYLECGKFTRILRESQNCVMYNFPKKLEVELDDFGIMLNPLKLMQTCFTIS